MKPIDFKDQKPRLIIEEYMSGNVKAWGILQNRSGKVTRQFSADLNGTWDGKQLILDEKFIWNDGEIQTRQWKINKIDEHNYEGTAGDVVGTAKGYSYGPAFKFEYVLLVPVKGREMKITFDDWIFMQDERVAINSTEKFENVFDAKVKELIYLGDHIRSRVEVCGNDQFIVKIPNSYKGANLKEGATVKLSWKASDSRALDLN